MKLKMLYTNKDQSSSSTASIESIYAKVNSYVVVSKILDAFL